MKTRLFPLLALLLISIAFSTTVFAQAAQVSPANGGDAAEPSTNGMFIITIDRSRPQNTTVDYTVSGTAVPGSDYTVLSGSVLVPAGATPTANITVAVIDDNDVEPDKTVIITLTGTDNGSVGIDPLNDEATVTIASDDAMLTLEKTVVNDEGGTAVDTDFTLTATGPETIEGVEGDAAITSAVVAIGDYDLSESGPADYTLDNWSCTSGLTGTTVTLAADDVVTCTVTNTDDTPVVETATLTLAKTVVNDEGGTAVDTDFTLTATGPETIEGVEGDAAITSAVVAIGDYDLTESGPAGYTDAGWSCTEGLTGSTVTLAADDVVTCTVTNTDDTPIIRDIESIPTLSEWAMALLALMFVMLGAVHWKQRQRQLM